MGKWNTKYRFTFLDFLSLQNLAPPFITVHWLTSVGGLAKQSPQAVFTPKAGVQKPQTAVSKVVSRLEPTRLSWNPTGRV